MRRAWIFSDDSGFGTDRVWASAVCVPDVCLPLITELRSRSIEDAIRVMSGHPIAGNVGFVDGSNPEIARFLAERLSFPDPRHGNEPKTMKPASYLLATATALVCAATISEAGSVFGQYRVVIDDMSMRQGHDDDFTNAFDVIIPRLMKEHEIDVDIRRASRQGAPGGGLTLADTLATIAGRTDDSPDRATLLSLESITELNLTEYCLTNIRVAGAS